MMEAVVAFIAGLCAGIAIMKLLEPRALSSAAHDAGYWRNAYETLVRQTGRDLNDGYGIDPRRPKPAPSAREAPRNRADKGE